MSTAVEEVESKGSRLLFYWEGGMFGGGWEPLPPCYSSNRKRLTVD